MHSTIVARHITRSLAALALVGLAACSTRAANQAPPRSTVPLEISNEAPTQAEVWVAPIGVGEPLRRIGVVMQGETTTLQVPAAYLATGKLNVMTKLRGRETGPWLDLQVRPDEALRLRLPRVGNQLVQIRSAD